MSLIARAVLLVAIVAGCDPDPDAGPPPRAVQPLPDPAKLPSPDMPASANRTRAKRSLTSDGVDGELLAPLLPATLGGVARTRQVTQAFAASAAYALEGGGYANLDLQSSFPSLTGAVLHGEGCFGHAVTLAGHAGCATESTDRYSVRWALRDRLAVVLAGPDEATVRRMAADIDFDALGRLAAPADDAPDMR